MITHVLLLGIFLFFFSVFWIWKEKTRSPPGPLRYPIIGNLIEVLRNDHRYSAWTEDLRAQYGSVFSFEAIGVPVPVVVVADPKCAHYILTDNFQNFVKGPNFSEVLGTLLGEGIFNVDGEKWERQRKVASYMFSQAYLKYMTGVFRDHISELVAIFDRAASSGEVLDTAPVFSAYTLDCFVEVAFGEKLNSLSSPTEVAFATAFTNATILSDGRFLTPGWKYMPWLPSERKLRAYIIEVNKFATEIIAKRRAVEKDGKTRDDLISFFLRSDDETLDTKSDVFLRDLAINFMLAGRDTTAATLTWLVYELARTPRVVQKLRAEIHATFPGNSSPDFESLKKLPYLKACIDETLRLYPPVPFDVKCPVKDDVLPNGVKVKAGWYIVWSAWLMGRDPEVYDAPTEFRPERWLGENGGKAIPQPQQAGAIPFQTGPRTCLGNNVRKKKTREGMNMAYIEVKLVVVSLIQRYEFSLPAGFEPKRRRALTLGVEGQMKLLVKQL